MSGTRDPSPIPLFDLNQVHEPLFSELFSAVKDVARHNSFINGKYVSDFETAFSDYHGSGHAVALSSGTDALLVSLMALGVGPGDEVITTPFTFVSTAEVIVRLGARAVFADIDSDTFCISAAKVASMMSSRTKAVIPVHLFGRACDMEQLIALTRDDGVAVIEDCAQAFGARSKSGLVGTTGDFGAFSFFPTKNLGCWGDGGMVLCSTQQAAVSVRAIRDHGASARGRFEFTGGNFRLDTIQAAVLVHKLKHVDQWKRKRQKAARFYDMLFEQAGLCGHNQAPIVLPSVDRQGEHSFGLYVVRARQRDGLFDHLQKASVGCGKYYDTPLHLQGAFGHLGYGEGDFPNSEAAARQVLALPCYAGISESSQRVVVEQISRFYDP